MTALSVKRQVASEHRKCSLKGIKRWSEQTIKLPTSLPCTIYRQVHGMLKKSPFSGESRASDKGGPDHPGSEIRRGGRPQKIFFRPFVPHFGLKIRGGGGGPFPLIRQCRWRFVLQTEIWGKFNSPFYFGTYVSFLYSSCRKDQSLLL